MAGSHLDRIGFRHLVMAIAALAALTGGLWTTSSFVGPMSNRALPNTPTIENAYNRISRFATTVVALNSSVASIIVLMSFIVDWPAILLPAYKEYAWIGTAWCIQLVSIIIVATTGSPSTVCNPNRLTPMESWSGSAMCSNWKAILVPSIIALVALSFHVVWHMIFRLCYKSILSNSSTTFSFWATPLPRKYLVRLKGSQRRASISVALGGKPRKTPTPEPPSTVSTPAAAQSAHTNSQGATRGYFTSTAPRVSADDLERGVVPDNASVASSQTEKISPPGLEMARGNQSSHTIRN
ncbi:hypothetical protein RhiLY_11056 [Ceratobasidium sp. AG-Ba]|nr:hypothetical protein RhiLY_11056 [Ceratobasidium sp. AG-Ba]